MSKPANKNQGRVALERALSKLGFASRTEAKVLIQAGSVKVHGVIETNPSRMVNPDTAHIEVNGEKTKKSASRIILFYKPKGVLTTKRDPEGRKTIYDLLPQELHSFHAVGRLDQHTSGLLLLTNDTQLSSFLTDPKNKIERTYLVTVRGEFTASNAEQAVKGIQDEGDLLIAKSIEVLKASGKESQIKITLTEGKNREIRRLCEKLQHEVTSLKRIQFGNYVLKDLKPGEIKEEN